MSSNYVVDFTKSLGEGATAKVFLGYRMDDGRQCAFKCSKEMLEKEVENMRKLDHKNIVMFYDSLINFKGYVQTIVMEYCNKGSLYDFVKLHKGLCDNMFLKVLECLNEGMSYLRSMDIIHRDIKPGNLMVHQDHMSYYHVKLGDLGTAKKVVSNENFGSMVGTVEYLHPDMYISLLDCIKGSYHANVDLWSMGVTLYHAAVTTLPFLPYNYNRNSLPCKETLRRMYNEKKPGIISGIQNSSRIDDITWSSTLPSNCRFSQMLKKMASKLIANLMDLSQSYSYERFFNEAKSILQKKRLLIFDSRAGDLQMLYLDNMTYPEVVEHISKAVQLPLDQFMVLTKNKKLEPLPDRNATCFQPLPVKGHLRYTLTDHTALVIATRSEIDPPLSLVSPEVQSTTFVPPSTTLDPLKDVKNYSNELLKDIYQRNYSANYIDCQRECYLATVFSFNEHVLMKNMSLISEILPWQMKTIRELCTMTESLITILEEVIRNCDTSSLTQESIAKCKEEVEEMRNKAREAEACADQYHRQIVLKREMVKFTERIFCTNQDINSQEGLDFLVHIAEGLVNEVMLVPDDTVINNEDTYKLQIWQRQKRLLRYQEEAKQRLLVKRARMGKMHQAFMKWSAQVLNAMNRIEKLQDFLHRQEDRRVALRIKFLDMEAFLKRLLTFQGSGDVNSFGAVTTFSENDQIKCKILEIQSLTQKMKEKFCIP